MGGGLRSTSTGKRVFANIFSGTTSSWVAGNVRLFVLICVFFLKWRVSFPDSNCEAVGWHPGPAAPWRSHAVPEHAAGPPPEGGPRWVPHQLHCGGHPDADGGAAGGGDHGHGAAIGFRPVWEGGGKVAEVRSGGDQLCSSGD